MRFLVPVVLLLVAMIHALPVVGVLGATKLTQMYGFRIEGASLEVLMRHRAVLFGLLAAFLAHSAFRPSLHGTALAAGLVSVVSFLALAHLSSSLTPEVSTVIRVDWLALALLVGGVVAHLFRPSDA
ncbi:MAG: phosphopantetheine adenylyltransferase [Proteobacteria bacterium]|nr:phosphopantetheine adenylyltransferase [Pseudomonadota bacterium]